MRKHLLLLFSIFFNVSFEAFAAYYDTLPKGVRCVVLRQVTTENINSSFTGNKQEKEYFLKLSLDARALEGAQAIFSNYLQALHAQSPEAYDALQLGEYEISADAQVDVQGLGVAFGITDRFTSYISFPYFNANVDIEMVRTKGNNNEEVQRLLRMNNSDPNTVTAVNSIIMGVTNSLPDASGGVIQSTVVNYYGYRPIGDWQGKGLGDIELAAIYRLTDWADAGLATTLGIVLPTGRTDDPDIIQDIAFGDGQFDLFAEFGGGFRAGVSNWYSDSSLRYTFQAPASKTLRVPDSSEYLLGSKKATFYEKLGDKIDFFAGETYKFNDMFSSTLSYLYNYTFESKYESAYSEANAILAKDTAKSSHIAKAEVAFTTVELFKKKRFFAPISLSVSGQKTLRGQNIPNYTRYDLEFRLFF
ncbi:MAG: hypothetical protein HYV97_00865 [Bdellovibrio sp.]|nr:hypothetical protein [Bdellovibrio sp.]